LPFFLQVLIGIAAGLTAVGVLWTKLLRPAARCVALAEELLPLLQELTNVFHDNPSAFGVLEEIAEQFRTDSGSSLRDAVNRIEAAATENKVAAEVLKVHAAAAKELSSEDRREVARMAVLMGRLETQMRAGQVQLLEGQAQVAHKLDDQISPPDPGA
jgi:peptide subunit release factor RF-3